MYQDLSTRHDWPVKKAIVDLPVRLKENSKRIFWSFFESVRGPESHFYKLSMIVANEPYTDQLYLQKLTWFLFTSVYFDTTVS